MFDLGLLRLLLQNRGPELVQAPVVQCACCAAPVLRSKPTRVPWGVVVKESHPTVALTEDGSWRYAKECVAGNLGVFRLGLPAGFLLVKNHGVIGSQI